MAARSFKDRAERVKFRNERLRLDALEVLRKVLRARADEPDQVAKDALLPKSEAPFYLYAATQIGAESVKREATKEEGPGTTLNVLIMGQAPSKEAWLEAVETHRASKAIEATVVVTPKAPK